MGKLSFLLKTFSEENLIGTKSLVEGKDALRHTVNSDVWDNCRKSKTAKPS